MDRVCGGRQYRCNNSSWRKRFMGRCAYYHKQSNWHGYDCLHLEVVDGGIVVDENGKLSKADILKLSRNRQQSATCARVSVRSSPAKSQAHEHACDSHTRYTTTHPRAGFAPLAF